MRFESPKNTESWHNIAEVLISGGVIIAGSMVASQTSVAIVGAGKILESVGVEWLASILADKYRNLPKGKSSEAVFKLFVKAFQQAVVGLERKWEQRIYGLSSFQDNPNEREACAEFFIIFKDLLQNHSPHDVNTNSILSNMHSFQQEEPLSTKSAILNRIQAVLEVELRYHNPTLKEFIQQELSSLIQQWTENFQEELLSDEKISERALKAIQMTYFQQLLMLGERNADSLESIIAFQELQSQQREAADQIEEPTKIPVVEYDNLPRRGHASFIDRDDSRGQILRLLHPESPEYIVTIKGVGGIGKSTLAIEVANYFKQQVALLPENERFDAIVWSSAKQAEVIEDQIFPRSVDGISQNLADILRDIAITFNASEYITDNNQLQSQILQRMRQHRTLLIIDNYETILDDSVITFLRNLPSPTKILITSKHRVNGTEIIELEEMSFLKAAEFMTAEWLVKKGQEELDNEAMERIYRRAGGNPLLLKIILAQMIHLGGIERVLDKLESAIGSDIKEFCFQESLAALDKYGPEGRNSLIALTFFPKFALSSELAAVAGLQPKSLKSDRALQLLHDFSLVNNDHQVFSILPMVREFILEQTQPEVLEEFSSNYELLVAQKGERIDSLHAESSIKILVRDYALANTLLEEGLDLARQINDQGRVFKITFDLSEIAYKQVRLDAAENLTNELQKIAETYGNETYAAKAYDQKGRIATYKGDFDEAFYYLEASLEIKRRSSDIKEIAYTLNAIANALIRAGDFANARNYLTESINMLTETDHRQRKSYAYQLLGDIEYRIGKPRKARNAYGKSSQLAKQTKDYDQLVSMFGRMARIQYLQFDDVNDAKNTLVKSITWAEKLAYPSSKIIANLNLLAQIYLKEKDYESAESYFLQALHRSEQVSFPPATINTYKGLSHIASSRSEMETALEYITKARILAESTSNSKEIIACMNLANQITRVSKDVDARRDILERKLIVATESGNFNYTVEALKNLYSLAREQDQSGLAYDYATQGFDLSIQADSATQAFQFFGMQHKLLREDEKHEQAAELLYEALNIFRNKEEQKYFLATVREYMRFMDERTLVEISNYFQWQATQEESVGELQNVLNSLNNLDKILKNLADPTPRIANFQKMAEVAKSLAKPDLEISYIEKALEVANLISSKNDTHRITLTLGKLCEQQKDYPLALEYYQNHIESCRDLNILNGLMDVLESAGRVAKLSKQFQIAIDYLTESLKLKQLSQERILTRHLTLWLGECHFQVQNYRKAKKYMQTYLQRKNIKPYSRAKALRILGISQIKTDNFRGGASNLKRALNFKRYFSKKELAEINSYLNES